MQVASTSPRWSTPLTGSPPRRSTPLTGASPRRSTQVASACPHQSTPLTGSPSRRSMPLTGASPRWSTQVASASPRRSTPLTGSPHAGAPKSPDLPHALVKGSSLKRQWLALPSSSRHRPFSLASASGSSLSPPPPAHLHPPLQSSEPLSYNGSHILDENYFSGEDEYFTEEDDYFSDQDDVGAERDMITIRGPGHSGFESFDTNCIFGNEVEVTFNQVLQLRSYMEELPRPLVKDYVCKFTSLNVIPCGGGNGVRKDFTTNYLLYFLVDSVDVPNVPATPQMLSLAIKEREGIVIKYCRMVLQDNGKAKILAGWQRAMEQFNIHEGDICMFSFTNERRLPSRRRDPFAWLKLEADGDAP